MPFQKHKNTPMVSDFIQKNVTILRIILLITMILYYVSSTLQASDVKVLLKKDFTHIVEKGSTLSHSQNELHKVLNTMIGKKKNFRIVIDAGHGGHDPGAVGKNASEKDLVLKMALKVGEMIQKNYPDVEVLQTRTTDVFIPLFRRIQYANEQNADLFMSIHCNFIGNPKTRGTETFVMGLHRAGENLEVAKRENASILLEANYEANYDGYDPKSAEGHIVMSMFQNAYLDKSIEFAADVESQFSAMHISKSRGVKQAGFAVLRRASMPAVLIEAGFLSNEIEEAFLMSDEGQQVIAESLLKAFGNFYNNNQNLKANNTKVKDDGLTVINHKDKDLKVQNTTKALENNGSAKPDTKIKTTETALINTAQNKSSLNIYYKVQIAAFKNEVADIDTAELRKIGKLSVFKQNDVNKYLVGDFINRESAEIAREKLKNLGYKGAFLVLLNE